MQKITSPNHILELLKPLHPKWPPNVRMHMSTRQGGCSVPPYESLNLGDHVGDNPLSVQKNRQYLKGITKNRPVFLKQVHGSDVVQLEPSTPDGIIADVCFSTHREVACTIMVADCLPILLTNTEGTLVGAAHAGWRGLAGLGCSQGRGVVENLMISARPQVLKTGSSNTHWIAWLGPCIGPEHFEVGEEVKEAFASLPGAAAHFKSLGISRGQRKWLANLAGLARLKLLQEGVTIVLGNDLGLEGQNWCTFTQAELFFSHRRDKVSGRMAASIWLT